MHVWNTLHAARWKHKTQKSRLKSPSGHHRTTLSGYIFAIKACIDNRKKLLSSNMSSRCPHNIVDFSPLAAEIGLPVWGTQLISTASRLGSITARQSSSEHQPNFAALNRGHHLFSVGWPSRWALAHILVYLKIQKSMSNHRRLE